MKNAQGVLVVNVGYETTEISILSLGGIVLSKLIKVGGFNFDEAIKNESEVISLEVRVSNKVAINLYEKFGFITMRTRKSYYQDNHEDAYEMAKALGGLYEEDLCD